MDAAQALADLTEISSQIEAAVLVEADGRPRARRRGDHARSVADDEHAPVRGRGLELRERLVALAAHALGGGEERLRRVRQLAAPALVRERRREHRALGVREHGGLDLRGDLRQVGESLGSVHGGKLTQREVPSEERGILPRCARRSRSSSPIGARTWPR